VAFARAIAFSDHTLLHGIGGYLAPTDYASGNHLGSLHLSRPWVIPLVVGFGGLLAGIVSLGAPEVAGSGTDEAINAANGNPRSLRLRAIPAKILASAFTIGSGGSAGPEGPSAQVAAGVGSWLTRLWDLNPADGRVAVAIGIGSGIGCVFRAPLGGALLSAEILYRRDAEFQLVIPSAIASIVGYTVYSVFQGFGPLLGFSGQSYVFTHPLNLLWFVLIGVLGAGFGLLYAKAMKLAQRASSRLGNSRLASVVKPAIGGLMTGAVAIAIPGVLGSGDGWTQRALGADLLALPLWFVLLMPIAKIVATAFTVGSGGSGGLFSPGMTIGAFIGADCWRLLAPYAPGLQHNPAPFVIVGMMCCIGSIARVPLSVTVMVAEMTSSIGVVAPAILAVGIATLLVGAMDTSLIEAQLRSREDAPGARMISGMPLLETLRVSQVMKPPTLVLEANIGGNEALARLENFGLPGAPVVDENGLFLGTVGRSELASVVDQAAEQVPTLGRLAEREAATISPDATLSTAASAFVAARRSWLTVLSSKRQVIGIITMSDLVGGYRRALRESMKRVSLVGPGAGTLELAVEPGSAIEGRALSQAALPPGTMIVSLARGDEILVPDGHTLLQAGDVANILVPQRDQQRVEELFSAVPAASEIKS
jgi:CIC family chloride channel protein